MSVGIKSSTFGYLRHRDETAFKLGECAPIFVVVVVLFFVLNPGVSKRRVLVSHGPGSASPPSGDTDRRAHESISPGFWAFLIGEKSFGTGTTSMRDFKGSICEIKHFPL